MSAKTPQRRGIMLVVSSPSGTGKTTLCRRLLDQTSARLSLSTTTRPARPGEQHGQDYHFCSEAEFDAGIEAGAFLEWAHIHGARYATPRQEVESHLQKGQDIIFDVDWQGARALKAAMPEDVVSVFLLPPSIETLRARLHQRPGTDPDEARRRLAGAKTDIERWNKYDYVLVNDDLDQTYARLYAILQAAMCRRRQNESGLSLLVTQLLASI